MPLLRATTVMSSFDEPTFVRRLSLNVLFMAVLTGGTFRLYRAVVLQFGWSDSWLWIAGTVVGGLSIIFLLTTLYLGNYPARSWVWRAPVFAILEVLTEISVSLALTLGGLERIGSLTATIEDWQGSAVRIATVRLVGIPIFALLLALVSTIVRLVLLPRKPALS